MTSCPLDLQVSCLPEYYLLLEHLDTPLIQDFKLHNASSLTLRELELGIQLLPEPEDILRIALPSLPGGEFLDHRKIDVPLKLGYERLQKVVEDEQITLLFKVYQKGQVIVDKAINIKLLAYNTVSWSGVQRESYACFITPNHPVIPQILKKTSENLKKQGLDGSLEGYQSNDTERVRQMTEALYRTFADFNISYIDPPAGYWSEGQRIRLPDQVIQDQLGTCADLTPLAASCLEQMGLYPILIFVSGHVYPGVFLSEKHAIKTETSLIYEVNTIYELVAAGELLLFNSSSYALTDDNQEQISFKQAIEQAHQYLKDFKYAINVYQARKNENNKFSPLPIRMTVVPDSTTEVISMAQKILLEAAKNTTVTNDYPDPKISPKLLEGIVSGRIKRWQDKLLDLSNRNRLLHLSNLDFSETCINFFTQFTTEFLHDLATACHEEHPDTSLEIQLIASQVDKQFFLSSFSFDRQIDVNFYLKRLVQQIPEAIQEIIIQPLRAGLENLFQKIDKRILQSLRKGKASFLTLSIPSELLGNLEDQLESGRRLELLPGEEIQDNATAIAFAADELRQGYCRTKLVMGAPAPMPRELLLKVARVLAKEARLMEEEQGASPLYLALGLLQWCDKATGTPRLAPLVLYPIELKVDTQKQSIFMQRSKGDPVGNITLVEKLRRDFEVDLDILSVLPEDSHGVDLNAVLKVIREVAAFKPGWRVFSEAVITNFNFGKFILWKDLQDNTDALLNNPLVNHIANAGRKDLTDPLKDFSLADLDQEPYETLPLVVDCDSSQLAAIYAALKGRSFVLQGPPGTGKSQTITNLIASCIGANKSVLFVAEKQAAVDVVHRRLKSVGLGAFCLDLHSQNNDRSEVLASLNEALQQEEKREMNWQEFCQEIESLREQLRRYAQALHQKRAIGFSIFEMLSQQTQIDHQSLALPEHIQVSHLTEEVLKSQIQNIKKFTQSIQDSAIFENNPWDFLDEFKWNIALNQTLTEHLSSIYQGLESLYELSQANHAVSALSNSPWSVWQAFAKVAKQVPLNQLPAEISDPLRWQLLLQRVNDWLSHSTQFQQDLQNHQHQWEPRILDRDLDDLIQQVRATESLVLPLRWIRGFLLKRRLKPYYKGKVPRLKDLLIQFRSLRATRQLEDQVNQDKADLQQSFPQWQGDSDHLRELVDYYQGVADQIYALTKLGFSWEHLQQIRSEQWQILEQQVNQVQTSCQQISRSLTLVSFPPETSGDWAITPFKDWVETLRQHLPQLRNWGHYHHLKQEFLKSSLGPILTWYESGLVALPDLANTYQALVLKLWFQECFDAELVLCHFNRDRHNQAIERFQQLEKEYLNLSQRYLRHHIIQRFPRLAGLLPGSEMAILKREITKKKSHLPIRSLFQQIPHLLPTLKPCFLMSPISVAQYLSADSEPFDLIIFDEASQIETHDAIGAIARGKQLIVVGDNKQMPPTNFFGRSDESVSSISEDDVEDLESILDEAIACRLPEQMLQWHYRSRHESLIEFSNKRYYNYQLNLFPAATRSRTDLGLQWHPIPKGYYQPGERVNRIEAQALVDYLLQQFERYHPDERSFGIITFSTPQQILIEQLLDKARKENPKLEPWFDANRLEYCFIKNLETVQGDERDEILFSICYAPQKNGRLSMNFGPLNRLGGERRLNVAVTRARTALHIFSTLTADQIDLNRTNALAVRHLKDFLNYAAGFGDTANQDPRHSESFDSDFHRQVYDCLRQAGYQVECQVGCAEYRIDFAILDPNNSSRYVLGIECDGYNYHSAATVRDRDHARQAVLKRMGWKLYRVWSIDWYLDRSSAEQCLLDQVAQAFTESPLEESKPEVILPPNPSPVIDPPVFPDPDPVDRVEAPHSLGRPYKKAILGEQVTHDIKEFYSESANSTIDDYLRRLIDWEAPIGMREAAQRISECWNFRRFPQQAYERVKSRAQVLSHQFEIYLDLDEDMLWKSFSQQKEWQGFRSPSPDGRALEQISKVEIQQAMILITQEALSISGEDLLRESLRQLTEGVRLTARQKKLLQDNLDALLTSGQIQLKDGRYRVP